MSSNSSKILNGKELSQKILLDVRRQVLKMERKPGLTVILIGDDPSSHLYVKLKKQACEACDIEFHRYFFDANCKLEEVLAVIDFLNNDPDVDGILVQLPLPPEFNTNQIISAISPKKDVDGFHPENITKIKKCDLRFVSPLVLGIVELIKSTKEDITGKNIVILCNHEIFGEPFHCFYGKDNKVEIVTLENKDYQEKIRQADVLIVSLGKAQFITAPMIKKDAIIIDVGINKENEEIFGDVDLNGVLSKVKFITPVPGGVGPMTIAFLLQNLLKLAETKNVK